MTGLFIVSVGWFAILYCAGANPDTLDFELAKALLQVGVVSVAATALSLLVFDHQQRSQEQKENTDSTNKQLRFRDDLLKGTLTRMTAAYNSTKRARRKLRAVGRRYSEDETFVGVAPYDEYMDVVNDAQLDLEAIKSDVKTSRVAYRCADDLTPSLRSMEQYLGELIEEYEKVRSSIGPGTGEIPLIKLPRLADFLESTGESRFSQMFSGAHDLARAAIRSDLLHLNLPTKIPVAH